MIMIFRVSIRDFMLGVAMEYVHLSCVARKSSWWWSTGRAICTSRAERIPANIFQSRMPTSIFNVDQIWLAFRTLMAKKPSRFITLHMFCLSCVKKSLIIQIPMMVEATWYHGKPSTNLIIKLTWHPIVIVSIICLRTLLSEINPLHFYVLISNYWNIKY